MSCNKNQLTSLDLTGLTNLRTLSCSQNQLTSLDLAGLTSLAIFYCHENRMTHLDITMLPALTTLMCGKQSKTNGNQGQLILILTSEQYTNMWSAQGYVENTGVTTALK